MTLTFSISSTKGFFIFPHLPHPDRWLGAMAAPGSTPPKEQACTLAKTSRSVSGGHLLFPKCPRAAGQQQQRVQVRKRDAGGLQARPETEQGFPVNPATFQLLG